jgi:hypothetical protein
MSATLWTNQGSTYIIGERIATRIFLNIRRSANE